MMKKITASILFAFIGIFALAQPGYNQDHFKQLHELLPTANEYRTASGAPGHKYWQQEVDYKIKVNLDDDKRMIKGTEQVSYQNNSPDTLDYLWLQLDQNNLKPGSDHRTGAKTIRPGALKGKVSFEQFKHLEGISFDGGYNILSVKDSNGKDLHHVINKTMMRIDLPHPLKSGEKFVFNLDWEYLISNSADFRERTGYEYFEEDGNCIYEVAQWYPRLCVYSDFQGWQNKQFLGAGEFALEFGDFDVEITVPADHVVAATGELQNPTEVLSKKMENRLEKAKKSKKPVFIVTPKEAKENEKSRQKETKTWKFKADSVRDFAFASSRKFIWDAMGTQVGSKHVMAMSLYPNEGEPMWSKFSTRAIAHTLRVYSRYTINYPYPVAWSINGPVYGMEYPMICFNGPRPEKDGTYSQLTKTRLISVIIHEVGHNFFPMIVNSDERQWTWMDEGLNSFCQFLAEQEWEFNYPSGRGKAKDIVNYMSSDKSKMVPIMTNSESILQFGNNAYGKPAVGLNILRETIMGRELFDYAFKKYAERWAFKHPEPADFFRTMEDASAVDLDWFWRGWFYGTDPVDISIEDVSLYTVDSQNPEVEKAEQKAARDKKPLSITKQHNTQEGMKYEVEKDPAVADFYTTYDPLEITKYDKEQYQEKIKTLSDEEKANLTSDKYLYVVDLENKGGMIMPIILELTYEDGSKEIRRYPVEVWTKNSKKISKLVVTDKAVKQFLLDPNEETADIDTDNNYFPRVIHPSKFELFKREKSKEKNLMQKKKEGKL